MDIFIEQVVKRKRNAKSVAVIIATLALLILLPVTCGCLAFIITPYFAYVGLFIFMIGIYLAWYFITSQRVEFEYSVTGDTLDVSKIVSKRKRKRVVRVEIKEIDLFCKIDDERLNEKSYTKHFIAAENPNDIEKTYCAVYNNPALGRTILTFTPNEKIRQAMKPYLKKDIVLEMFYHRGNQYGNH